MNPILGFFTTLFGELGDADNWEMSHKPPGGNKTIKAKLTGIEASSLGFALEWRQDDEEHKFEGGLTGFMLDGSPVTNVTPAFRVTATPFNPFIVIVAFSFDDNGTRKRYRFDGRFGLLDLVMDTIS